MKVLGIGEVNLDQYKLVNNTGVPKDIADRHPGGVVLTALLFLAHMGIDCDFYASLGRDAEGNIIRALLKSKGLRLQENPILSQKAVTKINTIIVDSTGQRTKLHGLFNKEPLPPLPIAYVQQFDIIIVDRHEPTAFNDVMRKKRPDAKLVIDPSTEVSDFTRSMLRQADYPIIPIESLPSFAAHHHGDLLDALHNLHELCTKAVVVTLGELGSLIYDGRRADFMPSLDIRAVDTCGAGDVFRGAVAYGALLGWPLEECVRFANTVAGIQCLKIGNATAVPTREDMESSLHRPREGIGLSQVNAYFKRLLTMNNPAKSI